MELCYGYYEKIPRKWWSPSSFLRILGGRNDNYSTHEVSLGTLVTLGCVAGVKKGEGEEEAKHTRKDGPLAAI